MRARHLSMVLTAALVLGATLLGMTASHGARAATVCTPSKTVGSPYAQDGTGDLCFQTGSLCSYVNSWNTTTLEINGATYTNLYVASNTIAPLNGIYVVHYVGAYAWSHFESGGACSAAATNTPSRTATVGVSPTPTRTITPSASATRTPTGSVTNTPTRTNTPLAGNTPSPTATANSAPVLYVGRFNTSDPAGPRSAWSATTIKANFSGTAISANLNSTGDNWYNVIIDGVVRAPVHVPAGTNGIVTLASGLPAGNHTIELVRRTEAYIGDVQFKGFSVTGGQLLAPPSPSARRIEFIGDSITAGYGDEGANQYQSFTPQNENSYLAYGSVTARALGADQFTIAWSGKGVIRNYGGDTTDLLPSIYLRILPYDTTTLWNPSQWIPQVVVINLGTNDFASGIPDKTTFTSGYASFVQRIRSQYPSAHIYLALGPMITSDKLPSARDYISSVVSQFNTGGDARVHFIEFPMQDGSLGYGEDWHPSVAEHALMASQLTSQIKADLDW